MAMFDVLRPVSALEGLLNKEKEAILNSDFQTLEKLFSRKKTIFEILAASKLSEPKLHRLKAMSEHNNRLLAASANGIRQAQMGLKNLKVTRSSFSTYGPEGQAQQMSSKSLTIKRKI